MTVCSAKTPREEEGENESVFGVQVVRRQKDADGLEGGGAEKRQGRREGIQGVEVRG